MPHVAWAGNRRCHVSSSSLAACLGVCAVLATQAVALSQPQQSCGAGAVSSAPLPGPSAAACSAELLAATARARASSGSQQPEETSSPTIQASFSISALHAAAAFPANRSAAASAQLPPQHLASWQVISNRHQHKPLEQTLAEIRAENDWKNGLVLWPLAPAVVSTMPRVLRSWVRNYLMCVGLFVGIAAVWAYYIYYAFGAVLFKGKLRPTPSDMAAQVAVWFGAIPLYAVMPAGIEWAAEAGWTRAYSRVGDVGLVRHVMYFTVFMAAVEAGVWAVHKWLHTQAFYRALHHVHHVYNKQGALSPFAGLAFHPLDGIMQAAPYCVALLVIPTHFTTFELLLLATGIWTTNIHDTVDGKVAPLLGAGYHMLHHITYRHNFGHYTTYMDWLMGTLLSPDQYEKQRSDANISNSLRNRTH